jgi:hypothetical protein
VLFGTSDHRPIVTTSDDVGFLAKGFFPHFDLVVYQTTLVLLEEFWIDQQKRVSADDWYQNYIRFLAALKNRLTSWREKEKYRPSLPPTIVNQLREVRRIRNAYYRSRRRTGVGYENLRTLLRTMTSDVRIEIYKYRTARWDSFLSSIQASADSRDNAFWSHLSKTYKPKSLPFSKLMVGSNTAVDETAIIDELFQYFQDEIKAPSIDLNNDQNVAVLMEYQSILKNLVTSEEAELTKTSAYEVSRIIRKIKQKKSSGFDQISNHMIKLLPPTYVDCLVNCFNTWLRECRYPKC